MLRPCLSIRIAARTDGCALLSWRPEVPACLPHRYCVYLEVAVLEHEGADEATTGGDERAVERRRTSSVRAAQGHFCYDEEGLALQVRWSAQPSQNERSLRRTRTVAHTH